MKDFLKKIILCITIFMVVVSVAGLGNPKTTKAQWATFDAANFGQSVLNVVNSTATSISTYSLQFKAFVLDTLATALAKQLIRTITADIVNWINGGFEGSPAFVTNPGGFLLDVADQISGEFLAMYGGPLTDLCSPFSIDIRLALAFKYHPRTRQKYACTLGAIIKNSKNAADNITVNGRSIDGFLDGDFNQGGWPAFVSLTTEPNNNIYGSYLQANSELSLRVANAKVEKRDEVKTGSGFISWRNKSCKSEVEAHNSQIRQDYEDLENGVAGADTRIRDNATRSNLEDLEDATGTDYRRTSERIGGDVSKPSLRSVNDCPIETPGSLIAGSLQTTIDSPQVELALVDSINEIVNALAAQMVNTILTGGLKALSGTGPSDSTSYINQVQAEAANGNVSATASAKNEFLQSVENYISNTLQFKTSKDQSLNTMLQVKNEYDNAKACYVTKMSSGAFDSFEDETARRKITEIEAKLASDVVPVATRLLGEVSEIDARYNKLRSLRDEGVAARTLNELNRPTQEFSQLLQSQSLITPRHVAEGSQELSGIQSTAAPLRQDAQRKLQECQLMSGGR